MALKDSETFEKRKIHCGAGYYLKHRKIYVILWLLGLTLTFQAVRVNVTRYLQVIFPGELK